MSTEHIENVSLPACLSDLQDLALHSLYPSLLQHILTATDNGDNAGDDNHDQGDGDAVLLMSVTLKG